MTSRVEFRHGVVITPVFIAGRKTGVVPAGARGYETLHFSSWREGD